MPEYDYHCENCGHEFSIDLSMSEHTERDKAHGVHCPKCKSSKVKHVIGSVFVTTSKKS